MFLNTENHTCCLHDCGTKDLDLVVLSPRQPPALLWTAVRTQTTQTHRFLQLSNRPLLVVRGFDYSKRKGWPKQTLDLQEKVCGTNYFTCANSKICVSKIWNVPPISFKTELKLWGNYCWQGALFTHIGHLVNTKTIIGTISSCASEWVDLRNRLC